ncbi:hypothetical protein IL252_07715 [Halomicrobium sp. IBSBa]|uniref:hypothetical protein n=1 Tax=Halomicrobium sp. IBSBa TaxID=2778916 RepID=UPI001ABF0567|nr:hypothetical protein [Halomicrobium sp. IBSBa]MBO4247699.1 hypothetical protein [Halomicrobium sp. IBSBa]
MKNQGHVKFVKKNNEVFVEVSDSFQSEYDVSTGDVSVASHGNTEYTGEVKPWGINHFFGLDDADTNKAVEIALYGAGGTAAASAIISMTGAGTIAAPALAVLSAFLATSAGLLSNANSGHGTVIKVHYVYTGVSWAQVDGQFEDDNGWPL